MVGRRVELLGRPHRGLEARDTERAGHADAPAAARDVELLARGAQARIRELGIYNATVKCFDGTLGWAANAPYDGILVAAGGPTIPEPLIAQLKIGGRLVVPVGESRESQRLIRVIKTEQGRKEEDHGGCAFVPLIGQHGWSDR